MNFQTKGHNIIMGDQPFAGRLNTVTISEVELHSSISRPQDAISNCTHVLIDTTTTDPRKQEMRETLLVLGDVDSLTLTFKHSRCLFERGFYLRK